MDTKTSRNYYTADELLNALKLLWLQYSEWTRFLIISKVSGLNDIEIVENRYLEIPRDFANLFAIYFKESTANDYENLLMEQYKLTSKWISDLQSNNLTNSETTEKRLYENADKQATFLSHINNNWDREIIKNLLYNQIAMTKEEILRRISHDYVNDIFQYDFIQYHALMIANIIWNGFLKTFY
jgi:hypothetical protein